MYGTVQERDDHIGYKYRLERVRMYMDALSVTNYVIIMLYGVPRVSKPCCFYFILFCLCGCCCYQFFVVFLKVFTITICTQYKN